MSNLGFRQEDRCTALAEAKQEKMQFTLKTLNSMNHMAKQIEQHTVEDMSNGQVTKFQKKYLFEIYAVLQKNLLNAVTLLTQNEVETILEKD